jgi:hypothetical protein
MRKIRFFYIFPVLLALVLFFPGCSNGSTPEKPPAANTKNGFLFCGQNGSNYIFLSIYQETTPVKLNSPKKGESWFYAVVVVTFDEDGDVKSKSVTSKGTVTVGDDDKLTFKADTGFVTLPLTTTGTLALSDGTISMKGVPGTIFWDIIMDIEFDITATPEKPFGLEPDDFTKPEPPSTEPPPSTTSPDGVPYKAGKIVTKFYIIRNPEWGQVPSAMLYSSTSPYTLHPIINVINDSGSNFDVNKRNMYFEGDPVNLTGTNIEVMIEFSDGELKPVKANEIKQWFVVEPPEFKLDTKKTTLAVGQTSLTSFNYGTSIQTDISREDYTLYLKNGFSNSEIYSKLPSSWQLSATFKGPPNGNIFPIKEITYNGNSSLREWLEDEVRVFPDHDIKDFDNKEPSVRVKWWGYNKESTITTPFEAGGTSIAGGSFSFNLEGRETNFHNRDFKDYTLRKSNFLLDVVIPNSPVTVVNPVTINVGIGAWSVPLKASTYHEVDKIESFKQPTFTNQIIFDDPRLYGNPKDPAKNLHWLDKLAGGEIKVNYVGTDTKRIKPIQEAFDNVGLNFINYNAGPFTSARGSVALNYYNTQVLGYEVLVYSNLVGIEIDTKPNLENTPYPVLKKANDDNFEKYLKEMVWVRAIYEAGKDGPRVKREDTYKDARETVYIGTNERPNENRSSTGTFTSNIDTSLVKATNNYKKVPKESTTVRVTFNTGGVKKYKDTQIGAIDYK